MSTPIHKTMMLKKSVLLSMLVLFSLMLNISEVVAQTETENTIEPFGAQLFKGNFLKSRGNTVNPNYQLVPGDKVSIAVWGAVTLNDTFTLDSQGNIFVPEIGPLNLSGIKNADLSKTVKSHFRKVYTRNFDVYTNLITAQPISVYVTGMVNNPGHYGGLPSDSVLYYLDLAGGINAQLGSYRQIEIIRQQQAIASIDLYDFLLQGKIKIPQLREGDTILVQQRGPVITLLGEVSVASLVELKSLTEAAQSILKVIRQSATATEVTVTGIRNQIPFNQTLSLTEFSSFMLQNGDQVELRADGRAGTILVRIAGEFDGPSVLTVKKGARLVDVLQHIPVSSELADTRSVYLQRTSVARAQKDAINDSLFRLERSALLAFSGSSGEVAIRTQEAELINKFVERARLIDPLGRVVTSRDGKQQNILLEEGDTIVIPHKTQIVRVSGEVMMVHALTWQQGMTVEDYIMQSGGFAERADHNKVIIHKPNAEVKITGLDATIEPGDEILIPPKVDPKTRQFSIDLLDVIYKIAVSAKVAVTL